MRLHENGIPIAVHHWMQQDSHETVSAASLACLHALLDAEMISSLISHVSALVLAVAGVALLFASDVILPSVVSGFPIDAAWLGQLLAAAWLGVAFLNWARRTAVLGGIYSRPVVVANLVLYAISALSLVRVLHGNTASVWLWPAFVASAVLAAAYGALLLLGPFAADGPSAS